MPDHDPLAPENSYQEGRSVTVEDLGGRQVVLFDGGEIRDGAAGAVRTLCGGQRIRESVAPTRRRF